VINKILILVLFSLLSSSFVFANDVHSQLLRAADNEASAKYVRQRFLQWVNVPFNKPNTKKKMLIIGDSHAQDFFNSVLESNSLTEYQIRTRYIPTGCQPFIGEETASFILPKDQALCETADNLLLAKEQIAQADVIILAANWKEWSATQLPHTIKALQLNTQQKLVVIGRKSFGKISIRRYLRLPSKKLLSLRNKPDAVQVKINTLMKNSLSQDVFVDLQVIICASQVTCPLFTEESALISFDGGHLTKEGAKYIGQQLFKTPLLRHL
jgi:hypothetical protein